ncbi:MAG: MSEP-CTERM sorting domain-containing protein [bacterium]|nr:MSEP-CTERM sorting domain-containing protein [bacterium]
MQTQAAAPAHSRTGDQPVGVRHPGWIIAAISVPQLLLLFFLARDYEILRTGLADEFVASWQMYLGALVLLWLGWTGYGIACLLRARAVFGALLSPALLALYISFLYLFLTDTDALYAGTTPAWIVSPDNGFIYALTFLTPALLYALILGVYELTPEDEDARAVWWNFAGVVLVPIGTYVLFMVLANVRVAGLDQFLSFLFPIFIVAATVAFFFLLIRGVILLGRGRVGAFMGTPSVQIPFRLFVGVLFPLAGLILNNNGGLIDMKEMTHVFGDFDHPGFYIFAVLNGLALLLPDRDEPRYRAGVFLARLFLFPYSLYFCIVFLPYLPLALLAIVFFGLGFLMLTPLVLTIVHLRVLFADYRYLSAVSGESDSESSGLAFPARTLALVGAALLLLWPLAITASYYHERRTLHAALDYVYTPNHANNRAGLDTRALRKTLLEIRRYKSSAGTPYLGLYYQWLVLDNLTVSDAKLDRLQRLFFGAVETPPVPEGLWGGGNRGRRPGGGGGALRAPSNFARLSGAVSRTVYDAESGLYRSAIDLTVSYPAAGDQQDFQTEYRTRFRLPAGARISEYYLDIAGKREYGMLAEKKSALWVYNQITSFRQDPGLLYYADPRTLALRVFPVPRGQTRTTGLEILHVAPFDLQLDGRVLSLTAPGPRPELIAFPEGVYVSASAKTRATPGARRPMIHFVLDCASRESESESRAVSVAGAPPVPLAASPTEEDAAYVRAMFNVLTNERVPDAVSRVRVVCANYEYAARTVDRPDRAILADAVQELRREIPRRGRFVPGRTIGSLLARYPRLNPAGTDFPVFIVVAGPGSQAGQGRENTFADLAELASIAPETTGYYSVEGLFEASGALSGSARLQLVEYAFETSVAGPPLARVAFAPTVQFDARALADARRLGSGSDGPDRNALVVVRRDRTDSIVPNMNAPLDPRESALARSAAAPGGADLSEQGNQRFESQASVGALLAIGAIESNHLLYPAESAELYLEMVRASFRSHLLMQSTSFLSVETEAQKLALKRKQDLVLRGHRALDAGEEPVRMDEPDFWLLALLSFLLSFLAVAASRLRRMHLQRPARR